MFLAHLDIPILDGDINLNLVYDELSQLIRNFIQYIIDHIDPEPLSTNSVYILNFIRLNYQILKQYFLDDKFFKELLRKIPSK